MITDCISKISLIRSLIVYSNFRSLLLASTNKSLALSVYNGGRWIGCECANAVHPASFILVCLGEVHHFEQSGLVRIAL